ncbi:MAG: hypothetical protein IJE87_06290, partial [Firmicutes bacterium]|nr:hypothetical protein [Bacillota bacterium]
YYNKIGSCIPPSSRNRAVADLKKFVGRIAIACASKGGWKKDTILREKYGERVVSRNERNFIIEF